MSRRLPAGSSAPAPVPHRLLALVAVFAMAACRHAPAPATTAAHPSPQAWLLGEVHDNAAGHSARAALLHRRLADGWRPAIAMEQFDTGQQAALDAAMQACADAECVVARVAPGTSGWTWANYTPVIAMALERHLPLLAANLSRADASRVVKEGFPAVLPPGLIARYGLDALPAPLLAAQEAEVRDSHCGMLPETLVEPMARAQIARDVVMAETLRTHADDGVVLLAGNGHVRTDIGVPYWLRRAGLAPLAEGFLEAGDGETGDDAPYDRIHTMPAAPREDPCAGFKPPGG